MVAREKHRSHYLLEITGSDWLSPVTCEARQSPPVLKDDSMMLVHRIFMLVGIFPTIPAVLLSVLIAIFTDFYGFHDESYLIKIFVMMIAIFISKYVLRFISSIVTVEIERYYRG